MEADSSTASKAAITLAPRRPPPPDLHIRPHQKALFYRLRGRPRIKWLCMMLLRAVILGRTAGLTDAKLRPF
jgi:hypothetical protein